MTRPRVRRAAASTRQVTTRPAWFPSRTVPSVRTLLRTTATMAFGSRCRALTLMLFPNGTSPQSTPSWPQGRTSSSARSFSTWCMPPSMTSETRGRVHSVCRAGAPSSSRLGGRRGRSRFRCPRATLPSADGDPGPAVRHVTGRNTRVRVEYHLWTVLDALGIPRCGVHAFRHSHKALLFDSGATPKVFQRQLRHADARTTLEIYGHVVGDAHREAVEKVASILGGNGRQSTRVN